MWRSGTGGRLSVARDRWCCFPDASAQEGRPKQWTPRATREFFCSRICAWMQAPDATLF